MRRVFLPVLTASLLLCPASVWAQINPCDLDNSGTVDAGDVQVAVNMSLGLAPCVANVYGVGVCNVVVVQRVANALAGPCHTGTGGTLPHGAPLSWTASNSASLAG